jgi:hypothetical protein
VVIDNGHDLFSSTLRGLLNARGQKLVVYGSRVPSLVSLLTPTFYNHFPYLVP